MWINEKTNQLLMKDEDKRDAKHTSIHIMHCHIQNFHMCFVCILTNERETIIHGRRYPAVIVMNEQVPPSCQDGLPALNRSGNQVNFVGVV